MTLIGADACGNCRYFFIEGQAKVCRRIPPHVHPIIGSTPDGKPVHLGDISMFPKVSPTQWCGEHVRQMVVPASVLPIMQNNTFSPQTNDGEPNANS